jgi:GrpB-like predicted nucleotidyltransferase (UPF0157 family)
MNHLRKIELVSYNINWPIIYAEQADKIKSSLGKLFIEIHHVGSTAVPGLASKDKIDICLQVTNGDEAIKILEQIGYKYKGEWNIPFKYGLTLRGNIDINLHMFDFAHPVIEANLLFRDYLRNNRKLRDEYSNLKYKILQDETSHQKSHPFLRNYTLRKSSFIKNILAKLKLDKIYLQYPAEDQEWEAVKNLRNKYIYAPENIEDPYQWSFNHLDHKHIILYKGVDIIGYAHLQLWPEQKAALRIIVIKEEYQDQNYGKRFMELIEKWLKLQSYNSVHIESSAKTLDFYKKLGFISMEFNDPDEHKSHPEDIAIGKIL